eukprot:5820697-Karenia_brevis.AAC.1
MVTQSDHMPLFAIVDVGLPGTAYGDGRELKLPMLRAPQGAVITGSHFFSEVRGDKLAAADLARQDYLNTFDGA